MHGRLLIVGIRGASPGDPLLEDDLRACAKAGVGGVILFDVDVPSLAGGDAIDAPRNILSPDQLEELVGHVRSVLGPDTWVSIDQEGGRVARLNPRRGFEPDPSAAEFATLDGEGRADAARRQASRLAELGFDLNFAPCVDLGFDPANPIITACERAYGARAAEVVDAARVVLDAHAEAGVAACLKHFPGHGSSRTDSHLGAVDITATWSDDELEPYRRLASRRGVAVMVGHLLHRNMDPSLPASLSPRVIDDLLRRHLGFGGVVVTDSIDMAAIADHWSPAEAAVAAIGAGADLVIDGFNLLQRGDHPAREIVAALASAVPRARLDRSLERIDELRAALS